MPKAQTLKVLDIGGQKHLVEDMSAEVQQLVEVYNEWNQDAVDARKVATQLQASVQMVQNQIGEQLKKEQQEAAEAEAAEAATTTTAAVAEGLIDPADGEALIENDLD